MGELGKLLIASIIPSHIQMSTSVRKMDPQRSLVIRGSVFLLHTTAAFLQAQNFRLALPVCGALFHLSFLEKLRSRKARCHVTFLYLTVVHWSFYALERSHVNQTAWVTLRDLFFYSFIYSFQFLSHKLQSNNKLKKRVMSLPTSFHTQLIFRVVEWLHGTNQLICYSY